MAYVITRRSLEYRQAEPIGLTFMSDLHIGARTCDEPRIKKDLDRAKEYEDRVNINGDVFDAIFPSDRKRFRMTALHPDLLGRDDIADVGVKMAASILGPYAPLIDSISMGNHETAPEKYHSIDMIARLIRRLNKMGGNIDHAGTIGFIQYVFRKHRKGTLFDIFHYHGTGGDSPVTKGMIGFNRMATWASADVLWQSHKHYKWANTDQLRIICPREGDQPIEQQQVWIMTGGYLKSTEGQTSEDILEHGRKADYASDAGMRPQGRGGGRLLIKMCNLGVDYIEAVI